MQEPDTLANESWFNNRWRPAMAWLWFTISACDFLIFPMFSAIYYGPTAYHEWHPLTLQGGGLFHAAMGAVVGIATWQRSQEKIAIWQAGGSGFSGDSTDRSSAGGYASIKATQRTTDDIGPSPRSTRAD